MPPLFLQLTPPAADVPSVVGIVVATALGLVAVFLLLPRPRAYPIAWGIGAGVLALLALGGLLAADVVSVEGGLFYLFAAVAVIAGTLLITQRNPARAALSFALVVLATCGLFLLQAAPFLMAATIIIYAGAIIVTFLFVLMLAQQEGRSDADYRSREPLLASAAGFVLLGALLYVLRLSYGTHDLDGLVARLEADRQRLERVNESSVDEVKAVLDDLSREQGAERVGVLPDLDRWKQDHSGAAGRDNLAALEDATQEVSRQNGRLERNEPPQLQKVREELRKLDAQARAVVRRSGTVPLPDDLGDVLRKAEDARRRLEQLQGQDGKAARDEAKAILEGLQTDLGKVRVPQPDAPSGALKLPALTLAVDSVRHQKDNLDNDRPADLKEVVEALAAFHAEGLEATAPLSEFSGPAANRPPGEFRTDEHGQPQLPADNVAYLGRSLFTDFLLSVELAGTLLLVATVGAIAIAHRPRTPA
jgi:NADH:ubiquinone oxidoreductase subunit 6 (subunit J)